MKAILKYNLDEPDDVASHLRATHSLAMALCLYDIQQLIRTKLKYEDMGEEAYKQWETMVNEFYEIINNHQISLDKLLI